ncbi:DNA modification methylase [Bradyrhizobium sp. USDA 377]
MKAKAIADDVEIALSDRSIEAPWPSVDLFVCSPPYFIGKEYDRSSSIDGFERDHERLLPLLTRALKDGGSICWQVGNHVANGAIIPLDAVVYQIFRREPKLLLRNRIVWTFGHGAHATKRFSGRHETLLWFTKGARGARIKISRRPRPRQATKVWPPFGQPVPRTNPSSREGWGRAAR